MNAPEDLRNRIISTMQTVAGIGMVRAHERYAHAVDQLKALYVDPDSSQLRGWFVRRPAVQEISAGMKRRIEVTDWRIQGMMALDDANASELTFDALIENLRTAFRADPTLGGAVMAKIPEGEPAGIQLVDAGPVMFGGVLCHGARLSLRLRRLTYSP